MLKKKNLDLSSPPQGIEHTETSAFQRRFNPGSLETRGIGPRHHPSKRSCENRPFYSATRRNSTRQLRIPVSSPIYLARVATNFRGRGGGGGGGSGCHRFRQDSSMFRNWPPLDRSSPPVLHRLRSLGWRGGEGRGVLFARRTRRKISRGKRSWLPRQCASTLVERTVRGCLLIFVLGIFGIFLIW